MTNHPYADLGRPPLSQIALRRALGGPGGWVSELRVVSETGSTNADVVRAAKTGVPEGFVLIAESQRAGRGRLGRVWQAPARASLTFSLLTRPSVAPARLGWLPLLAGVAAVGALHRIAAIPVALKWPNDLLAAPADDDAADSGVRAWGKCGGILAESVNGAATAPAVVIGIGLNVSQRADELPAPPPASAGDGGSVDPRALPPTSMALAGSVCADRDPLLRAVIRSFVDWYRAWVAVGGDPEASGLRAAYQAECATLRREVLVRLPGKPDLCGHAEDIDADGRLVVVTAAGATPVAAGDVLHVR